MWYQNYSKPIEKVELTENEISVSDKTINVKDVEYVYINNDKKAPETQSRGFFHARKQTTIF